MLSVLPRELLAFQDPFLKDSVLFSIVEWFHICMKHFESNVKKLTKLKNQFVFITDILF